MFIFLNRVVLIFGSIVGCQVLAHVEGAEPTKAEAKAALVKAVDFFHANVARHGGYVYLTSSDLKLREAEGIPSPTTVWVQPPGTPAVGDALLDAWLATKDERCRRAVLDAGHALARGQLHSGGWDYKIHFSPDERKKVLYRRDLDGELQSDPTPAAARAATDGWTGWKKNQVRGNRTTLDDDVTQAAIRFLIRLDAAMEQKDAAIHDAATYGLAALLRTQYPNGGWSVSWDRLPDKPPSEKLFPVQKASFPDDWPRAWPKDFTGCYVTNDGLMERMIDTLLLAHETYGNERYLEAAKKAGDFLILAQLPAPQPAWAQQYDASLQPAWSRAFEPPAVTGGESQGIMRALIQLARATGDDKYLEPIPAAIQYLRTSAVAEGKLARFYELKTNRPLYFRRGAEGKPHEMVYEAKGLADHYSFIVTSKLDKIEREYEAARARRSLAKPRVVKAAEIAPILAAQDERGAWPEPGTIRDAEGKKTTPADGILRSETFIRNVQKLSSLLN